MICRSSDTAIGDRAIGAMPEEYNLRTNNCQTFVIQLLDIICRAGRLRVHTSYGFNQVEVFVPRFTLTGVSEDQDGAPQNPQPVQAKEEEVQLVVVDIKTEEAEAAYVLRPDEMADLLWDAAKIMHENTPSIRYDEYLRLEDAANSE